ncbi:MAG: Fic family protein [Acholeplasma sp.]|nr:Fic family protein [Acholeplasma sp.]
MLGNYEKKPYGLKQINVFIPYTLNGLLITSKRDSDCETIVKEIESLLPIETPVNRTFYRLIQDTEMLESMKQSIGDYTLSDLYAPSGFNLFYSDLIHFQEVYDEAPSHINKIGYANRFLKDLHYGLFQKHQNQYPGEFRRTQSFLGNSIDQASYIPPDAETMIALMEEMELFMYRDDVSVYIRSALLYYQIATSLPFLIGNLELARMASLLYLIEFDGLKHYITLSRHLTEIESIRMTAVETGDINLFIKAFLTAILEGIKDTQRMIVGYNKLKHKQEDKIEKSDHTIYQKRRLTEMLHVSHRIVYLESEPLQQQFNVLPKTIMKRYRDLMELDIIGKKSTYFSNIYYNKAMLKLFE